MTLNINDKMWNLWSLSKKVCDSENSERTVSQVAREAIEHSRITFFMQKLINELYERNPQEREAIEFAINDIESIFRQQLNKKEKKNEA